ncbi:hypothetical protein N5938_13525 [Pseudomonas aeruginosa]|uniref:hypothetical protein n=1 Tax=Pseudomonas aeruginosa TaxID=287 RepID=UPI0021F23E79|nr:hypothetical protein [Pseudomonas aeruginosa]UYM63851.1 hypothetical protein N5938_13525 [Pseudomonas aeruginosa]
MTEQRTLTIRACDQHGDIRQDLTQQAEAERPEAVAFVKLRDGKRWRLYWEDEFLSGDEIEALMTVAQHERIVKAWIERWKAYIELSAKIAAQRDAAQAEVEALRAELQSQRERNTELIFKLGSATNGWGRCEKRARRRPGQVRGAESRTGYGKRRGRKRRCCAPSVRWNGNGD